MTFLITQRQFIRVKSGPDARAGGQRRESVTTPQSVFGERLLSFDTTGTRTSSRHCPVFSRARQGRHRRDGLMCGCLGFGEMEPFQFDGGEHERDRLSNGSNLQGGERHLNKSKLCHSTAPFLHHRKCFSQSTVRILGSLET